VNNSVRQSMSLAPPLRVLMEFTTPDSDHEKSQWILSDIVGIAIAFTDRDSATYQSISAAPPRHTAPHRRDNRPIEGDGSDNSDDH
jgi:hypothetical protein